MFWNDDRHHGRRRRHKRSANVNGHYTRGSKQLEGEFYFCRGAVGRLLAGLNAWIDVLLRLMADRNGKYHAATHARSLSDAARMISELTDSLYTVDEDRVGGIGEAPRPSKMEKEEGIVMKSVVESAI